jgi:hypothetical protein
MPKGRRSLRQGARTPFVASADRCSRRGRSAGASLDIDIEDVLEVLFADGWHVVHGESFELGAFDFTHRGRRVHGGGDSGVCATGFSFVTDQEGSRLAGPLTSILALRHGCPAP